VKHATSILTLSILIAACGSSGSGSGSATDGGGGAAGGGGSGGTTGNCHSDSECQQSFMMCFAPDQVICGGMPLHDCDQDADCADAGADQICLTGSCSSSQCVPKCVDDQSCPSTPPGLSTCDASTGHCVSKPCTSSSCPQNFSCNAGAGCVRKTCAADGDCAGACVNGSCYSGPGTCSSPPG
jgi:hypothetical protein